MTKQPPHAVQEPIAIIGMACIFPQAPDLQAFWNNILNGVDAVGEPVPNWDAQRYLDSGRIKTPFGGYLGDLYRFDPREFGIMPSSVDGGEPDHFLALRVARDALLDAGCLRPDADHRDTGIILGHSTYLHRGQVTVIQNNIVLDQTMALLHAALPHLDDAGLAELRKTLAAKLPPTNADTAPGLVPNVMTGRIANRLNLRGPNYLVDAACSSSLLAVAAAVDELRAGRSRTMLAGGVNASLPADVTAIFTQLGALSARGKVRPFEAGGDGTLLGEGLGIVVLKRLSDALADGNRVYACLRGIGQASDGRGTGLLAPSVEGETLAIRRAYDASGVDPATISLIEAHGTGIPLGDKTEIAALKAVFGERAAGAGGSIALGSVKSMISHCIPAAGIAGLIKTALALHHRVLPPTLCEQVNPELGIERTRLFVNTEAMPWIAPAGRPRRAGVDSFGFGGINTHAIVEQAPPVAKRPPLLQRWPFELCVLSADSAAQLAAAAQSLLDALARHPHWQLDEIAAALAAADRRGPVRLALVAKSREALAKSLAAAVTKLRSGSDAAWSTRTGAHFASRPQGGQMAFLFPGEGSQYLGMFADLAMCFDEVREWLDFWRGLYPDEPGRTRTDIAFPPATELSPERRLWLDAKLHQMDIGSEAVMVGGQAMFSLLRSLGVRPDAMLGHSSGESSALTASGALPADRERLAEFIRQLNTVYQRVLAEGKVPTGALLAVGALPAAMVHATVRASGRRIELAMDNCANQLVLYGTREDIDDVQARLVAIGGICMPLPFDRGYHTPDFAGVSAAFARYYRDIELGAPQLPLYSCASAQRFPASADGAQALAAAQWSATVRFRETVLAMHADGVRCFVEVGPSANLTAFVDDVLAELPHLALASNQRRKHGLEQLLQTLAQLWVNGRSVDAGALFAARRIAVIDLAADTPAPKRAPLLDNTMPVLRLDDGDRVLLQRLAGAAPATPKPGPAPAQAALPAPIAAFAPAEATLSDSEAPSDAAAHAAAVQAQVLGDYFETMRAFLAHQQAALALWQPGVAGEAPAVAAPFLDRIVEHDAQWLRAECHLAVHRDAFLRDHVLSGRGSATDPELLGLACVPLMVSLEIMAEACAVLVGSTQLALIEQVRAVDWIALDAGELLLEVTAERIEGLRCRASLRQDDQVAISAEFVFAPMGAVEPLPSLGAAQPARWDGQAIYDVGMFHGPIFQSLQHIRGWNGTGIDAELGPCALDGFFEPGRKSTLLLNPVLLDAMGQLAACWVAEHVGTDFNCFPSSIARIAFAAPSATPADGVVLRGRQQALDPAQAGDIAAARTWSFDALDAAGRPLLRVDGLVNVFFPVPHRYYQVRRDPLAGWLGEPLHLPGLPGLPALWQLPALDEAFCAQSNGIFLRILAHATLSFEERDAWLQLPAHPRQRRQWLLGRLALKEAVRHWVHARTGETLYPSDVVVLHDAQGAPWVDGWWAGETLAAPRVSLSHSAHANIAAVADADQPVGVDTETIGRVQRPEWLSGALAPSEQAWLATQPGSEQPAALLRLWCAKEAAAKWCGTGLQGAPEAFAVRFDDATASSAWVRCGDTEVAVQVGARGDVVVAVATGPQRTLRVH